MQQIIANQVTDSSDKPDRQLWKIILTGDYILGKKTRDLERQMSNSALMKAQKEAVHSYIAA